MHVLTATVVDDEGLIPKGSWPIFKVIPILPYPKLEPQEHLIFTSQHAVRILKDSLKNRSFTYGVVGPETEKSLKDL